MPQPEYLQFGGMAVPEGVMMRSPNYYSVACRAPNGDIVVTTEPIESTWIGRQKWLKKPFLRGTLALLDTMGLGLKAMRWASDVQLAPKYQKDADPNAAHKAEMSKGEKLSIGLAVLVSLVVGFAIFDASPVAIAQFTQAVGISKHWLVTNYIEETIKVVLFLGYLLLIRRMPAILDVFRYHGAEHKAINALERRQALEPEVCLAQTRLHPRCGTNFAIMVLLISFLLFPLVPRELFPGEGTLHHVLTTLSRIGVRLVLLPLVAGISYEVIRAAGRMRDQRWVDVLLKPGLATQLITTEEPEKPHMEVAIASLQSVLEAEKSGVLTKTDRYSALDEPSAASTAG